MSRTIVYEYVQAAQREAELANTRFTRAYAPDSFMEDKFNDIRLYLAQALKELDASHGKDSKGS